MRTPLRYVVAVGICPQISRIFGYKKARVAGAIELIPWTGLAKIILTATMSKKYHYKSTITRVRQVQELVRTHYEPGRQDRCKRWVYRTKVLPMYGISEKTFYEYLGLDVSEDDDRQLKIDW